MQDDDQRHRLIAELQELTERLQNDRRHRRTPHAHTARRLTTTRKESTPMEALYTAEALATGAGRDGRVATSDGNARARPRHPEGDGRQRRRRQPRAAVRRRLRRVLPLRTAVGRPHAEGEDHRLVGRRPRADRIRTARAASGSPCSSRSSSPTSPTTRPRPSRTPPTRCAPTPTRPAATSTSRSPSPTTDPPRASPTTDPTRRHNARTHP